MFRLCASRTGSCFVIAAALLCAASPSQAQAPFSGPCSETLKKYCQDVVPGDGRVMKCLDDHREDQSLACKDWVAEQQKSLKELNSACREEIMVLCRYDPSNGIRIFQCLIDNYAGLKLDCRNKLREIRERLQ